jgi:predicted Rossmann fold flavoprotein
VSERADLVVVGAGAAGLMAATWAGRTRPGRRVVVLESARTLGAKILVAGGGRCNVTHHAVTEDDFSGSTAPAIRKVLRRFGVEEVVAFFREQGVALKREETGKLFPTTDSARTVLDALLRAVHAAGAEVRHPCRVESIAREGGGFRVAGAWGAVDAPHVIMATGGKSLPRSGSDGHGLAVVAALGHEVTPLVVPGLVPLVLDAACFLRSLPGVATDVELELRSGTGRRLLRLRGALLCTHFGISGPVVLDMSRHLAHARAVDPGARLVACLVPGTTAKEIDAALLDGGRSSSGRTLTALMPERLARELCEQAGVDASAPASTLTQGGRRALVRACTELPLPVQGDRGFGHAEVTAGGVPLAQIRLETMESRRLAGLFLCGEILDVDGRIGGFNFQWAWASGYVAGISA